MAEDVKKPYKQDNYFKVEGNMVSEAKIMENANGKKFVVATIAQNTQYEKDGAVIKQPKYFEARSYLPDVINNLGVAKKGQSVTLQGSIDNYEESLKDKAGKEVTVDGHKVINKHSFLSVNKCELGRLAVEKEGKEKTKELDAPSF